MNRGRRRKKRRTRNGKPPVGTPTPKLTKTYLQVQRTHRQSPPVTQFICWLSKSSKCIIDREAPGFLVGYNTRNRRNMRNRCEEGREGGAEVAGNGSVCAAITYCSIATISQPPTIRISHRCFIMEQITRLDYYPDLQDELLPRHYKKRKCCPVRLCRRHPTKTLECVPFQQNRFQTQAL